LIIILLFFFCFFFFFQAEDGIRDIGVTGVQTCALPICQVELRVEVTLNVSGNNNSVTLNSFSFQVTILAAVAA